MESTVDTDVIVIDRVKVVGTSIVRRSQGSVIGYNIETEARKIKRQSKESESSPTEGASEEHLKWSVVRTEYELESFNNQVIDALTRLSKGEVLKGFEEKLSFPIRPYSTGLELLPVVALGGSMVFLTYGHSLDVPTAFLISLIISSIAFMIVLAFGFAKLPLTWSAPKRIEPLNQYFDRVLKMEGMNSYTATIALLQEPLRPDWPARVGPIDLSLHDLPHEHASTEWWYYNAHLTVPAQGGKKARDLSVFVCFFRLLKHVDDRDNKFYSHALTWALVDPENENKSNRYVADVLLERDAPKILRDAVAEEIKTKGGSFFRRALLEVLEKGNVPLPDRLFTAEPKVSTNGFDFDYEHATLTKDAMGRYVVKANNGDTFINLTFDPVKPAVRHGDHGVVAGHSGDEMYYYFIPRLTVFGEVGLVDGKDKNSLVLNVSGDGWYDHEFGGMYRRNKDAKDRKSYAWNWVSAQLDDGSEVTAALLVNAEEFTKDKKEVMLELKAVVINKDGERSQYDGVQDGAIFEPLPGHWNSVRTFKSYPTAYKLVIPAIGMDVVVTATIPDQEFMTLLCKPSFWEGRCDVVGTTNHGKTKVKGLAFVERNGFDPNLTVGKFFKGVNEEVLKSVAAMYPNPPTREEAVALAATDDTAYYVDNVPLDILGQTLIAPVRTIADRGGKSWRSYAALATIDVVGGDSRNFVQWIAMPEFLHVGSLLIDDIQDDSLARRGGPCAHLVHGIPLTINAGTAAYFMVERLLSAPHLSKAQLLECYQLYFGALRGGHAGQALDIHGNDYLMDEVVKTGNADVLEKRILAIHMLKTAVPAGTLARMGSLVGGGSKEQIEAVGKYFEGVGLAFQIQDDVLNLRGIYSKGSDKMAKGTMLKTLGEDIADGKVTMPVCKYMALEKSAEEREKTWNIIKSKPKDQEIINGVISTLEKVGAIDACVDQANQLVEDAWEKLDPIVPDSFPKMMLRSFGWYVNEQGMFFFLFFFYSDIY